MIDAPTPPDDCSGPEEREPHEPAPRRLTRWIWVVAVPGFYVASFLTLIVLDRFDFIPSSLYGPLRVIYFPFIALTESFGFVRDAVTAFLDVFDKR